MILSLKIPIGFEEVESKINLDECQLTNEEIFKIFYNEIKGIKMKNTPFNQNNKNENNEIINELLKKNEEMEEKIKLLIKYNEENDKEKKQMNLKINNLIEENKILKSKIDNYTDKVHKKNENNNTNLIEIKDEKQEKDKLS